MAQRDEELIGSLLPQNPELKVAWDEHGRLASAVEGLLERSHLTASEEVEKKNFQKLKLIEKNKITWMSPTNLPCKYRVTLILGSARFRGQGGGMPIMYDRPLSQLILQVNYMRSE